MIAYIGRVRAISNNARRDIRPTYPPPKYSRRSVGVACPTTAFKRAVCRRSDAATCLDQMLSALAMPCVNLLLTGVECYTAVLHRSWPAALETPDFEGLFRC